MSFPGPEPDAPGHARVEGQGRPQKVDEDLRLVLSAMLGLSRSSTGAAAVGLYLEDRVVPGGLLLLDGDRNRFQAISDMLQPGGTAARGRFMSGTDLMEGRGRDADGLDMPEGLDTPDGHLCLQQVHLPSGRLAGTLALLLSNGTPPGDSVLDGITTNIRVALRGWMSRQALQQDLQDSRKRTAYLKRLVEQDPLTRLLNTTAFEQKARDRLEAARLDESGEAGPEDAAAREVLAFALIDIDHFKSVNDVYGHPFGDDFLRTVAAAIDRCFGATGLVGRLGGDEFGVLFPLPDGEGSVMAALQQCRAEVLQACATLEKPDLGRISIGAALCPRHGHAYEQLYYLADLALYASKSSGRGTSTLYSAEVGDRLDNSEALRRFRQACRDGQVRPFFQPIMDLRDGRVTGYEVLCRWSSPRYGLLGPEEFAAIFKDHGMASDLTRHILRSALRIYSEARTLQDQGIRLSFNLTYFDLNDREFVFDFQSILTETGVSWDHVMVEVQESVMMGEPGNQVFRSMEELRQRGAQIALDDFGTGHGGLTHLRTWPVDLLKIDRSFIRRICDEPQDRAIVRAILGLSRDLGFKVVAEGIETEAQLSLLRLLGCDLGQGFALGKPRPPAAFRVEAGVSRPASGTGETFEFAQFSSQSLKKSS